MARSLTSDVEWSFFASFLSARTGRPPKYHRRVSDGMFWISRTGWRELPAEFGHWNSVWRQWRRWCLSGIWDAMLEGFADSGGETDLIQMIDSTTVRAHRCAAGQKGGFKACPRPLAGRLFEQDPPACQP
jgi:transposase